MKKLSEAQAAQLYGTFCERVTVEGARGIYDTTEGLGKVQVLLMIPPIEGVPEAEWGAAWEQELQVDQTDLRAVCNYDPHEMLLRMAIPLERKARRNFFRGFCERQELELPALWSEPDEENL